MFEAAHVAKGIRNNSARVGSIELFERRFQRARSIIGVGLAALAVLSFFVDPNVTFGTLCFTAVALIFTLNRVERDVATLFLILHPSVMYLATTVFYAAGNGNFALDGLFDKTNTSFILLIYQLSIVAAYIISRLFTFGTSTLSTDPTMGRPLARNAWLVALTALGLFFAGQVLTPLSILKSSGSVFMAVFFYCIAFIATTAFPRPQPWIAFFVSIALILPVSLAVNQRTAFFLVLFVWLLLGLHNAARLRWRFFAWALVGYFVVNLVTYSFLEVRAQRGVLDPISLAAATIETSLSPEAVFAAMPFSSSDSSSLTESQRSNKNYSELLQPGGGLQELSVFGRVALLARMDIVTGRLGTDVQINWPEWENLFVAAAPNFGQDKNLILSDEIVWDLGLRDRLSVGRPLVTVAGELYAIGGYSGLIFLTVFFYGVIFIELRVIRAVVGYTIAYVVCVMGMLYTITMTGTALDLTGLAIRDLVLLMPILWATNAFLNRSSHPEMNVAHAAGVSQPKVSLGGGPH